MVEEVEDGTMTDLHAPEEGMVDEERTGEGREKRGRRRREGWERREESEKKNKEDG